MKTKPKLTCTSCSKKFPQDVVSIECSSCYLKGFDKEREKLVMKFSAKVLTDWKGQNEFADWIKKDILK